MSTKKTAKKKNPKKDKTLLRLKIRGNKHWAAKVTATHGIPFAFEKETDKGQYTVGYTTIAFKDLVEDWFKYGQDLAYYIEEKRNPKKGIITIKEAKALAKKLYGRLPRIGYEVLIKETPEYKAYLQNVSGTYKVYIDKKGVLPSWASRVRNPAKTVADEQSANELLLWIKNSERLYRQQFKPIVQNLIRKIKKGTFDYDKSIKLWSYLADNGAKDYNKEVGEGKYTIPSYFNKATRMRTAEELAKRFIEAYEVGEYNYPEFQ